jgi:subtilase family serine protease
VKPITRGLAVLISTAAVVAAGLATAATTASALAPTGSTPTVAPSTVYACDQAVALGFHACMAVRRSDLGFHAKSSYVPQAVNPALTPSGFGPTSLQSAYSLPSATAGSGQRVYIIDAYDDPNAESDLAVYRSQYGLSPCTTANGCFQKLNQNGLTSPMPSPNTGWAGEISLDLDMVSAACPKCGITLIESTNNGSSLYTAVKEASTLGGKFVSMSWGGGESSSESSIDAAYFKSSGVVYAVSTGDSAYAGGVEYPAASPLVVAVGGTSLTTASNARGWNETVWKTNSSEGAGSGCSSYETKPSWQSVISSTVCSRRAEADVSAVADPATGVAVYQSYGGSGWTVYGGTSAAAPIVASVYALAGTPGSTDKPSSWPYAHTANLNDVTAGNNGSCSPSLLCTAAAGWDGPTGLGTPNGIAAFTANGGGGGGGGGNTVTVTNPGSQSSTVGTPASLAISATDSGGATLSYGATGLPAGLSINAGTGVVSGTPTTAGTYSVTVTATDTTSASGSTTFAWAVNAVAPTCAGQLVKNPGFESGSTSWSATAGVINTNGTYARTGKGYGWIDGYGTTHTDTLSQAITIPAGCHATLTYYLRITSSDTGTVAHDILTVTAGGTAVQSFSNLNRATGYVLQTVNLSAFAGQTVTLKWSGTENSSLATSFIMDDTAVTLS